MDGQLKKLTSLVDNLLDISRVQQGKLELNETIFDFDQFVSEKLTDMEIISPSHILKKSLRANRSIFGDYDKLGQVLTNLILNSVKYSPGNSTILIQTKLQDEGILLSVQDNGIGIASENLLNIFKQFYRVDDKIGYSGMGIGLYISAEIIIRHGGKLWAESQLGQGAIFNIWLPFSHRPVSSNIL